MSQRDRLLGRRRPHVEYHVPVQDPTDAVKAVEEARNALTVAQFQPDEQRDVPKARKALEKAEKRLEAYYEPVTLRALPPDEFEILVGKHPARDDTDDEAWNTQTFPRACFHGCVEGDMTEAEWDQFLAENCSQGERAALYDMAVAVNVRTPSSAVPKG